uniref:Reverse transcriptase domain-containing protein n=1 Tax=Anolis carolinensis TaxID=28377 RepID=A0A803SRA5_ANOCA
MGKESILICNIYMPNGPKQNFVKQLRIKINETEFDHLLIMGDFNGVIDFKMDKSSHKDNKKNIKSSLPRNLFQFMNEFDLWDIWRLKNPNQRDYTYYSSRHQVWTRIDMIWTSKSLAPKIEEMKIQARDLSDHCPITMTINKKDHRVNWRLDNNLIKQKKDIESLKRLTKEYFQLNDNENVAPQIVWDAYKAVARGFFIQQKARNNKIKSQKLRSLQEELEKLEHRLKINPKETNILVKIKRLQKERTNIQLETLANQLKWTRQNSFENANKPGKWLARLIRKKKNKQQIIKISAMEKEVFTDDEIKAEFLNYYKNLYKKEIVNPEEITSYICRQKLQKISDTQRLILNKEITEEEIKKAIKDLKSGKSPGPDGFIAEFYKIEQIEVTHYLKKIMNIALKEGKIPDSWKQAEIILIHKDGTDSSNVRNYRPISLLNNDYKIYTKILAERFTTFLKDWISEDQAGFLPNRSTKDNIRIILDAIEYYDQNHQKEVGFLSLDAEKAFDNVNWEFFKFLFAELDMGVFFQNGINAIYSNQFAKIKVNNVYTDNFEIQKGTRQGCPLSPLIFIFTLEVLMRAIKEDKNLTGIKIGNQELKLRAFADDVICILENPNETIKDWLRKIEEFGVLAGFKINANKTTILTKNMTKKRQHELKAIAGLEIVNKIKYLGIWITNRNNQLLEINYRTKWQEIKRDIEGWKHLKISLMGRIAIIKMNILPKLLYLFRNIPIIRGKKLFVEWNWEINKFIWQNKKPRIKFSTMITPKERGGFDVPSLQLYHDACALEWTIDWVKLEKIKLLTIEGFNLRWGWHGYLWQEKEKVDKQFGNHFIRSALIGIWKKYKRHLYEKTPLWFAPLEATQRRLLGWQKWPTYREVIKISNMPGVAPPLKDIEEIKKQYKNITWLQFYQLKECYKRDKEIGFNTNTNFWDILLKREKKIITLIYNKILEWNTEMNIIKDSMLNWSRNIGRPIMLDEWETIWNKNTKLCYSIELKENWLKTIHRWYITPKKLGLMYKDGCKICWHCGKQVGSYFHMWWGCKIIKKSTGQPMKETNWTLLDNYLQETTL